MDDFFRNFNYVVRYLASGMMALVSAHMFNNQCLQNLNHDLGAKDSWLPMLFLAATSGLLIQAFNSMFMWWIVPFMLTLRTIKDKGASRPAFMQQLVSVFDQFRWYNQQRWLRRASDSKPVQALQREIDMWGSLIHFAYCSALALILTPPVMAWAFRVGNNNIPWYVCVITGLILLVVTGCGDRFKLVREFWISEKLPQQDPSHPEIKVN